MEIMIISGKSQSGKDTIAQIMREKLNKKMWFRQVIVPGINDTREEILKLKEFSSRYKNVERIELLPYHLYGLEKYKKMKIPYRLENVDSMDLDKCSELQKILEG